MADGIRLVALPWLAATITRDPVAVAAVAAAALPWLVASLPAGVLADRSDRRALIVGAHLGNLLVGLSLAVLSWSGGASVTALMALAMLAGFAEVVIDTTARTLLPAVVKRRQVVRASATWSAQRSPPKPWSGVRWAACSPASRWRSPSSSSPSWPRARRWRCS